MTADAVIDASLRYVAPTHAAWIEELRGIANAAKDETALAAAMLDWASKARANYATDIGDAIALAGLIGRNSVEAEAEDAGFTEPSIGGVKFKEAHEFLRQKIKMPSKTWAENLHQAHDRAFVVAGADSVTLTEDLFNAFVKGKDGGGIEALRKGFDEIVERTGWQYKGGRNWRTRVIYETNIRTAHMAGRLAQMRDPDVVKARPFWQYVHGETREPKQPRHEHLAWDGKVFAHDDPIWAKIFPPNGWKCSCGVRTLSAAGLRRLGKEGPDKAPVLKMRKVKDPATGDWVDVPEGIDFGWAYQPGDTWERGIVPSMLQEPLSSSQLTFALPDVALEKLGRPFAASVLPSGKDMKFYVERFLSRFGAAIGKGVLYRDASGQTVVISDALFKRADDSWKALKRGRELQFERLAETVFDPDEIWIDWAEGQNQTWRLVRRYLRWDKELAALGVFEWSDIGWSGVTMFDSRAGKADKPSVGYLEKQRRGALLFRRGK